MPIFHLGRLTQRHPDSALPTTLVTLSPGTAAESSSSIRHTRREMGTGANTRKPRQAGRRKEKTKRKEVDTSSHFSSESSWAISDHILRHPLPRCPQPFSSFCPKSSFCWSFIYRSILLCGTSSPPESQAIVWSWSAYRGKVTFRLLGVSVLTPPESNLSSPESRVSLLIVPSDSRLKTRAFIVSNLRRVPLQPSHAL